MPRPPVPPSNGALAERLLVDFDSSGVGDQTMASQDAAFASPELLRSSSRPSTTSTALRPTSFNFQAMLGDAPTRQALLPYPAMVQRKDLARELYQILRACNSAYEQLPRPPVDEGSAPNAPGADFRSVDDCRRAIGELSYPKAARPGAFPHDRATLTFWIFVGVLGLPAAVATYWAYQPPERTGELTWDWGVYFIFQVVPLLVYFGLVAVTRHALITGQITRERLAKASCIRRCYPAGPAVRDELPLYCDDASKLTFCQFANPAKDEDMEDYEAGPVTRSMFVARCLSLCVPAATAGEQHKFHRSNGRSSNKNGFPFDTSDVVWLVRMFEVVGSGSETVSVPSFARFIADGDCEYCALDIECIAAYSGVPDDMEMVDALVLMCCLWFDGDGPAEQNVGARLLGPAPLLSLKVWQGAFDQFLARAVVKMCEEAFLGAAPEPDTDIELIVELVFGPGRIRRWLMPGRTAELSPQGEKLPAWDAATLAHEEKVRAWEETNRKQVVEYLTSFKVGNCEVGLEHLVDVVLQLWKGEGAPALARVHSARAHFEAVAGSLQAVADPNELLDLVFGPGRLLPDERARALAMLDAAQLGLKMDLNRALQDMELHARTTSRFDLAEAALQRVQSIKAKQGQAGVSHVTRYSTWVTFAMRIHVPCAQDNCSLFASRERPEQLRTRLSNRQLQEAAPESYCGVACQVVTGLYIPALAWKNGLDPFRIEDSGAAAFWLLAMCVLGLGAAMTAAPIWFSVWMVVAWSMGGDVPAYVACAPLALVLTMVHFIAKALVHVSTMATRDPVPRLALSRAVSAAGSASDSADGDTLRRRVAASQKENPSLTALAGALIIVAEVSLMLSFINYVGLKGHTGAVVDFIPDYWRHGTIILQCFFLVMQVALPIFAILGGFIFGTSVEAMYASLCRLAGDSRPVLDLHLPENLVLWCRLRDCARHDQETIFTVVAAMASVGVVWSALAGLASLLFVYLQAAWTPFRVICLWYALVGGATAFTQVLAVYSADRSALRSQRMLEDQLSKLCHEAGAGSQADDAENGGRAALLRAAIDAVRAELDVYRQTPERRFFYLLGQPAGKVLASVGSLVAVQALGYGWAWLNDNVRGEMGGSSSGTGCTRYKWWFKEQEGC
jgi:hypothetical protein